jgi:hypothetical protein
MCKGVSICKLNEEKQGRLVLNEETLNEETLNEEALNEETLNKKFIK